MSRRIALPLLILLSAATAVATLTVLSKASDKSATDPVICQATVLRPRTTIPITMLPKAILMVRFIATVLLRHGLPSGGV